MLERGDNKEVRAVYLKNVSNKQIRSSEYAWKTYQNMDENCSIFPLRGWRHSTRPLLSCYLELAILLLRIKKYVCLDLVFMSLKCFIRMFFFFLISLALHDQVATIQGLSGTGSLRLAAALIERYFNGAKVLISAPTWGTLPWLSWP